MSEKKKEIKVQSVVVVGCVIFAVLMIVALFVNLAKIVALKGRETALEQKISELDTYISQLDEQIDFRQTAEYIDRYAREYLNMKGEDEKTSAVK